MPGKDMASITKFYQRAKKAKDAVLKQYINEARRLGTITFFDQLHKSYSVFNTTYLKKGVIKSGSKLEALITLRKFMEDQQKWIRDEIELLAKPSPVAGQGLTEKVEYKEIRENYYQRILTRFGRKLKALGNTRIEEQGKVLLEELLGPHLESFKSTLKLGESLDSTSSKVVEVIKKSKDSVQGKSTVNKKPQTFGFYIKFPTLSIKKKLQSKGMLDHKFRPTSYKKIMNADDINIIAHFNSVARGLLNFYSPSHNFWDLRSIITYSIRYSLLATLGHKHKGSISKALKVYGKTPKVILKGENGKEKILIAFISEQEVAQATRKFRISSDKEIFSPKEISKLLEAPLGIQKLSNPSQLLGDCAVKVCTERAVE